MSFWGKKYKRVRCENVEELMKLASASDREIQLLKGSSAVFSFLRLDDQTIHYTLKSGSLENNHQITLGKEHQLQRRDGDIVLVTYHLPNHNTIRQVIKQENGKILHFSREFGEKDVKMTISVEGSDQQAHIYYEVVEE